MKCQIYGIESMSDGLAKDIHRPLIMRLKIVVSRQLGPSRKRTVKKMVARFMGKVSKPHPAPVGVVQTSLKAGDRIRVKSREQITAMLGQFHDLKGLVFMEDMWQYCGTEQRVMKPLARFVDERELRVRKGRGIVLLEGLMCEGAPDFGPCDRSCFYFWREEWLERVD